MTKEPALTNWVKSVFGRWRGVWKLQIRYAEANRRACQGHFWVENPSVAILRRRHIPARRSGQRNQGWKGYQYLPSFSMEEGYGRALCVYARLVKEDEVRKVDQTGTKK